MADSTSRRRRRSPGASTSTPARCATSTSSPTVRAGQLLMVASDRISAFDFVLDTTIPDKGEILTRMSLWWFDQLADLVPHHVVSTDVPEAVRGRAVVCERLEMFPVECVARGYLTGSGLLDYQRHRRGLRHRAARRPRRRHPAARADLHAGHQGRARRPRRERLLRRGRRHRRRRTTAAELRELTLAVYAPRRGDRPRARHHPGRHQARVRPPAPTARSCSPTRCSPRLLPLLAGRRVAAGPARSRRTTSRSCATGCSRPSPAGTAPSGEPPPPLPPEVVERTRGRVRRGVRAAHRGDVLTTVEFTAPVDIAHPPEKVFGYLADPRNRPEWQSSLLSVTLRRPRASPTSA